MLVSLVVFAGLVGYGAGHVTLNNPEANSVAETTENKTIVYASCPITCKCGYNEHGWISKATCTGSDPAVLLGGAAREGERAVDEVVLHVDDEQGRHGRRLGRRRRRHVGRARRRERE